MKQTRGQSRNMVQEVSALMGAADEEEWARAGLFNTVDELGFKSVGRVNQNGLTALGNNSQLPPLADHSWTPV